MAAKKWCLVASMIMAANLMITAAEVSAESPRTFRQENGLQVYAPPAWFLKGSFIAREKNPGYVFGPVQRFVDTLGGTTTWLIEDMELERLEAASADRQKIEYSLFLEAVSSDRTVYWVFVVYLMTARRHGSMLNEPIMEERQKIITEKHELSWIVL